MATAQKMPVMNEQVERRDMDITPRRAMLIKKVEPLLKRYYPTETDPYRLFEREVAHHLRPEHTLLDVGCGRYAPVLALFNGRIARCLGVDLVSFPDDVMNSGMELMNSDIGHMPVATSSVDVAMSRSVLEHVEKPVEVYREINRVLKLGGKFTFITPNIYAYPMLAASLIPNRFHGRLVMLGEGRLEQDTFDTHYRSNSSSAIRKLAAQTGFEVRSFRYLNMFPHYLMFNIVLFRAGLIYDQFINRHQSLAWLRHWILATLEKTSDCSPANTADRAN